LFFKYFVVCFSDSIFWEGQVLKETSLSLLLGKKLYMVKFNNSAGELYIQTQRRLKFHQKRKPIHRKLDICDLQVAADTLEASSSQERDKQKRKREKLNSG